MRPAFKLLDQPTITQILDEARQLFKIPAFGFTIVKRLTSWRMRAPKWILTSRWPLSPRRLLMLRWRLRQGIPSV